MPLDFDEMILVDTPDVAALLLLIVPILTAVVCFALLSVAWRRRGTGGDVLVLMRGLYIACGMFLAMDMFAFLRSVATALDFYACHSTPAHASCVCLWIAHSTTRFSWMFLVLGGVFIGVLLA